jgi:hypothetical protein
MAYWEIDNASEFPKQRHQVNYREEDEQFELKESRKL